MDLDHRQQHGKVHRSHMNEFDSGSSDSEYYDLHAPHYQEMLAQREYEEDDGPISYETEVRLGPPHQHHHRHHSSHHHYRHEWPTSHEPLAEYEHEGYDDVHEVPVHYEDAHYHRHGARIHHEDHEDSHHYTDTEDSDDSHGTTTDSEAEWQEYLEYKHQFIHDHQQHHIDEDIE